LRRTASTTLKTAVLAPMPSDRVKTTAAATPGRCRSVWNALLKSDFKLSNMTSRSIDDATVTLVATRV
jgi:hypothetical protein